MKIENVAGVGISGAETSGSTTNTLVNTNYLFHIFINKVLI
jgi:hypothetical protein